MTNQPSILIVGAGPVGMSAAVELRRRGFDLRIIDQANGPAGESRALGIHARTLELFEPAGVTQKLLAAGHRVRGAVLADNKGDYLQLDFTHARQRFNFVLVLPQSETEKILLKHVTSQGVTVEWQTQLVALDPEVGQVQCRIVGPSGEDTSTYDIVIGTDGAHSFVRRSLGIAFDGATYEHDWSLADVRFAGERSVDLIRIKEMDGAFLAYFPLSPDSGRFVYSGPDGLSIIKDEVRAEEVLWHSLFRISHRIVQSFQRGRVFLAGDAAHIHSPVGGRGMNLGIEDAATLAWLIESGATDCYTSMRLPIGRKVLKFTDAQTRHITSKNRFTVMLRRNIAPLALKSRAIQRMAFRRLSGADTPRPQWL